MTPASDVMTRGVRALSPSDSLVRAAMADSQIRRMPVVDSAGKLVGIVSIGDIAAKDPAEDADVGKSLGDISAPARPDRSSGKS